MIGNNRARDRDELNGGFDRVASPRENWRAVEIETILGATVGTSIKRTKRMSGCREREAYLFHN